MPQSYARALGHPAPARRGAVWASDKRALFVGLAAYEAAGGTVERDLFDERLAQPARASSVTVTVLRPRLIDFNADLRRWGPEGMAERVGVQLPGA